VRAIVELYRLGFAAHDLRFENHLQEINAYIERNRAPDEKLDRV
jgi:hypothetical protein